MQFLLILLLIGSVAISYEKQEPPAGATSPESTDTATADNLLFEETFEGDDPFSTAQNLEIGDWDYALQYVSSPVYGGAKSARFEIRKDQPLVKGGKRAEVTIVGAVSNKDRWYSFAVYLPSDGFSIDSQQEIISQWHQRPDYHLGENSSSPATALRIKKDRFILDTGYNTDKVSDGVNTESREKIDLGFVTKDVWHEFVFHFIHSYGTDGLIEVWHNGNKILTHTGGNIYNNVLMPKWKIGLYKSSFKYDKSDVNKRVIYFDNIRVGNEHATFEDMTSGTESTTDRK